MSLLPTPHVVRQTSIDTYHAIVEEGLYAKRKADVYRTLYFHGPMTQGEVAARLIAEGVVKSSVGGVSAAFRPMELETTIYALRVDPNDPASDYLTRPDATTGRACQVWDVTSNLPVKPPPRVTVREALDSALEAIARLKTENLRLQAQVAELQRDRRPRERQAAQLDWFT